MGEGWAAVTKPPVLESQSRPKHACKERSWGVPRLGSDCVDKMLEK